MSDATRPDGRDWLLAYEELDPAERREADRYLTDHPELAAQIQRLREVERQAVREIPAAPDDGFWTDEELSPDDEARCRESARRIRAVLLEENVVTASPRPWARLRSDWRWWLPIAAVLAVAVIAPRLARHDTLMTGLAVEAVAATSDGIRSADLAPLAAGSLRNGDAFVLAFELTADSYLAVVHVDPVGKVALVYPQAQSPVARLGGGQRHRLPDPDQEEMWILDGATGRESFLVATDREQAPSVGELSASLAGLAAASDRAATLDAVRALLQTTWDQVEVIEFSHVDY